MKILVTRVNKGEVFLKNKRLAAIKKGLTIFVSFEKGDNGGKLDQMAKKVINLRIFENREGKMDYSLKDKNHELLCISNFTLAADTSKGRRPSFENALAPQEANKLFTDFVSILKLKGVVTQIGAFGEHMDINLALNGPVNILLEGRN